MSKSVVYDILDRDSLRMFRDGRKARCRLKINLRAGNEEIAQAAVAHLLKIHRQVQENLAQRRQESPLKMHSQLQENLAQIKQEDLLVHKITLEYYVKEGETECDSPDYADFCRDLFGAMIVSRVIFDRVPAMFKAVYQGLHIKHGIGVLEVHHIPLCTSNQRSLLEKPVVRSFPSLTFRHCKLANRDVERLLECAVERRTRQSEFLETTTIYITAIESLNVEYNHLTKDVLSGVAKYALTRLTANSTAFFSVYLGGNNFAQEDLTDESLGDLQTIHVQFPARFAIQVRRRHALFTQEIDIRETFDNFADVLRDIEMEMVEQKEMADTPDLIPEENEVVDDVDDVEAKGREDYSSEKGEDVSEEEGGDVPMEQHAAMEEPLLRSESYNRNFEREWAKEFPATPLRASGGSPDPLMRSMLSIRKKLHSKLCPKCKKMITGTEMAEHMEYHRTHALCDECHVMVPNAEMVKHSEHEVCGKCGMIVAKAELTKHMEKKHKS